jgi:Tol biopolymer transport system component
MTGFRMALKNMAGYKKALKLVLYLSLLYLIPLVVGCSKKADPLPHSVYFLSGPQNGFQVWRMETDGTTFTQLTDEQLGVDSFSVSPTDGSLAYITGNQLVIIDPDGENCRLVAESPKDNHGNLIAFVDDPIFSPDGQTLAYAFGGLHLYDVASSEDNLVLKDGGNLLGEPFVFTKENYTPGPWSPDGDKLLIIMGYFEGSTLAIMEPGKDQPFTRLISHGPVCCTFHWSPDGKYVYVANSSYGIEWPGLWKYDSDKGEETELVTTKPGQTRFAGWPRQLSSGYLIYFYGEEFSIEEGIPLVMVQSGPDGEDRIQLRPETFHIMDALWAEDSSLVLIVNPCEDQSKENDLAQLVLVRPDGSPLKVLFEANHLSEIAWGP